jgi:hypothetical protein
MGAWGREGDVAAPVWTSEDRNEVVDPPDAPTVSGRSYCGGPAGRGGPGPQDPLVAAPPKLKE